VSELKKNIEPTLAFFEVLTISSTSFRINTIGSDR